MFLTPLQALLSLAEEEGLNLTVSIYIVACGAFLETYGVERGLF
jgi:hypothetical protein